MRRRKHLSGNAKGHSDAGKIQAAGLHSGDNRHDDSNMSLRHTGEHADDEADAGDDTGTGSGELWKAVTISCSTCVTVRIWIK